MNFSVETYIAEKTGTIVSGIHDQIIPQSGEFRLWFEMFAVWLVTATDPSFALFKGPKSRQDTEPNITNARLAILDASSVTYRSVAIIGGSTTNTTIGIDQRGIGPLMQFDDEQLCVLFTFTGSPNFVGVRGKYLRFQNAADMVCFWRGMAVK